MNIVYRTVHGLTRVFYKTYGRWRIIGHDRIPKSGGVVVACNHVSYLDPPMVGSAVMRECRFMARHDLWNRKWLGRILDYLGSFPVDRDKPGSAPIRTAIKALKDGYAVVMFPEGGRSEDGTLRPAEGGIALIVQKSGAPVVPCAVIGPDKMLPVGAKRLTRVRLKIVFGSPIWFTPDSSRDEIGATIMSAIAALVREHGDTEESDQRLDAGSAAQRRQQ